MTTLPEQNPYVVPATDPAPEPAPVAPWRVKGKMLLVRGNVELPEIDLYGMGDGSLLRVSREVRPPHLIVASVLPLGAGGWIFWRGVNGQSSPVWLIVPVMTVGFLLNRFSPAARGSAILCLKMNSGSGTNGHASDGV